MLAHLIGTRPCDYASNEAKALARQLRLGDADEVITVEGDSEKDEDGLGPAKKKRKEVTGVAQSLRQTELKVFRGIAVPFNAEQIVTVRRQFLRATISANLPFRWADDIEVIKLFMMFRSTADNVIPSQKTLAGRLLNEENEKVEEALVKKLKGQYGTIS
jgi:16S rRNA A1518/A1519 N6-dimethyltransferase RsmA/KsgA/DIM1 with predicted DNA glycosylase/AP lyase activity